MSEVLLYTFLYKNYGQEVKLFLTEGKKKLETVIK